MGQQQDRKRVEVFVVFLRQKKYTICMLIRIVQEKEKEGERGELLK